MAINLVHDPLLYEGVTYVPLGVVANVLGVDVNYDKDTKMAHIETMKLDIAQPDNSVKSANNAILESESSVVCFRDTTWGMSREQVIKIEDSPVDEEEDSIILFYNRRVNGKKAGVAYEFNTNDELYSGSYLLTESHTNDNLYISDYESLIEAIIEKYGEPTQNNTVWRNDLLKNDPSKYGLAVSAGHLVYSHIWEINGVTIQAACVGDNFKITTAVIYTHDEKAKLINKEDSGL